jgi:hypothetical protein
MRARVKLTSKKISAKKDDSVSQTREAKFSHPTGSAVDQIQFLQRTNGNRAVQKLFNSDAIQLQSKKWIQTASVARKSYNPSAIKSACLCENCLFITFVKDADANKVFEFLFEVKVRSPAFFRLYKKYKELSALKIERLDRSGKEWKVTHFEVVDQVIRPKTRHLLGTLKNCRFCKTEVEKTSERRTYKHPQKGEMTFHELESYICAGAQALIAGGGKAPARCTLLAAHEHEEELKPIESRFSGPPVRVPIRFSKKSKLGETETPYLPEYVELAAGTQIGPIRFLGRHPSGYVFKRWSEEMQLWLVLAYPKGQCATAIGDIVAEHPEIAEKLRKK